MTRDKKRAVFLALAAAGCICLLASGCASAKKKAEPQKPPETVTQAAPAPSDTIEYLDVSPWVVNPGGQTVVEVRATKDRTVTVQFTGLDGLATGKTRTVSLQAKEPGLYNGVLLADSGLPLGKYRVDVTLSGGLGEPVKLVSSRVLTVAAPTPTPPPRDACDQIREELLTPHVFFAYDKADIDAAAAAWLKEAAGKLAKLGPQVVRVTIEGHCDERGTVNYNLALGARRAGAVKKALVGQPGIAGLTIEAVSKGKEQPAAPQAKTEEEHAKNRRAFFVVDCAPTK